MQSLLLFEKSRGLKKRKELQNRIKNLLDEKGIKISDSSKYFKLQGQRPLEFEYKNGHGYVYTFNSDENRDEAIKEYVKIKETYDMAIPFIIKIRHALIFYFITDQKDISEFKEINQIFEQIK